MSKKPELNEQQKVAADPELALPAVVTASAGSGKTFVLVERVIRLVCDRSRNIPIDSLAIMTFTRNAARSMREKINKALDERLEELNERIAALKADPSAEEELIALEDDCAYVKEQKFRLRRTMISTIDAFCLKMIKENIELFDLPVNFSLADNARKAAFQMRAVDLAMEEFYDENGSFTEEERSTLFYTFSFDSDDDLRKAVINFGNDLSTYVDADKWLDKALNVYKDEKSLEAQYSDTFAEFLDAYFRRGERKGQIQKYFERFGEALDMVLEEGRDKIEELEAQKADLEARSKSTASCEKSLKSAKTLVNDIIPDIRKNLDLEKEKYEPVYEAYEKFRRDKTISSLYDVCEAIKDIPAPQTLSTSGAKTPSRPLLKKCRDYGAAISKELASICFSKDDTEHQRTAVRAMIKLERLYMGYYQGLKKDSACVGFSDCELMLLNKLKEEKSEEFRRSLRERFKYIIVDEFQDSNDIQAELFGIIGEDRLFYVGDIKQSIYAFRGGNPKIMAKLVDGENGFNAVPLSKNYRSRKTVLDVVNHAFSGLMTRKYGDVDYSGKDNSLEFGARYLYSSDGEDDVPDDEFVPTDTEKYCAELRFISGDADKENEAMRQPRFVAKRIKELHDDPDFLITKGKKRVRPDYSDFFVLVRNKGKITEYRKALAELDIPSTAPKGKKFLTSEEIGLMLDLLAVIDNPLRNEEMLKVLMSPIYRFTAEEVTDIRLGLLGIDKAALSGEQKKRLASVYRNSSLYKCLKDCSESKLKISADKEKGEDVELARNVPQKLARFMSDLKNFRYYMSSNSLNKLVSKIYEDTDAELIAAVFEDSAQRVANVRLFRDMAADFEQRNGGSLGDFLRFIERVKSNESQKVEDANRSEDTPDAVQIMSFHVSKGLEAPICILCELNDTIAAYDYTGAFLNNRENYFAMQDVDYKKRVKSRSFAYSALRLINRRAVCGEELRVLYVALTRAQEKLIMVTEKELAGFSGSVLDPLDPEETFKSNVAFDWILQSLARYSVTDNKFDGFNCVLFDDKFDGAAPEKPEDSAGEYDVPEERLQALNSRINFRYAHTDDTQRQEKFTVTELAHRNSDAPITLSTPDFIEKELSGADRGNAYHNCMQYISFDKFGQAGDGDILDTAKSEIERLFSLKRLNEREVKCVEPKRIADFFSGELGKRALAADRLVREEEFLAQVSGAEIGEDDLSDIMLQGRVDMYFIEDGEIVVVDYKTDGKDNLEKEKENYAKQVKIYSTVLNKTKGLRVKEVYLYSFTDGEAISIK